MLFKHDCENCTYLGTFEGRDLYACARNNIVDTVIARYGNQGSEYASGLAFSWGQIECLTEARERAEKLGMIPDPMWCTDHYKNQGK